MTTSLFRAYCSLAVSRVLSAIRGFTRNMSKLSAEDEILLRDFKEERQHLIFSRELFIKRMGTSYDPLDTKADGTDEINALTEKINFLQNKKK